MANGTRGGSYIAPQFPQSVWYYAAATAARACRHLPHYSCSSGLAPDVQPGLRLAGPASVGESSRKLASQPHSTADQPQTAVQI